MTKEQALQVVNNFIKVKELMEESDKIVKNCNKWAIDLNIANFEDFVELCELLELPYYHNDWIGSNKHYKANYKGLDIVCVVFAKGEEL